VILLRISHHTSTYQPGTGRITLDAVAGGQTTFWYDAAGNTEFTSNQGGPFGPAEERASFYAADGRLRAVDRRFVVDPISDLTTAEYTFDEYRYDALGRRIWLWSKKTCVNDGNLEWWESAECRSSLLRRTVWNGNQELVEIQMPGGPDPQEVALYEEDTAAVQLPNLYWRTSVTDRNQFFGRVVYVPGRGVDQPIAVTRIKYGYQHDDNGSIIAYKVLPAMTTMPFWNRNGDAQIGVFSTGARRICNPPNPNMLGDCVGVVWPYYWSVYDHHRSKVWDNWHGTILESKRDKTNLGYNRNRYYDPQTGRFTQEDPMGLAGGLNLYGFTRGDPVNFADPLGLAVCLRGTNNMSRLQVAKLMVAVGEATHSDIVWQNNCVKSWKARPGKGWEEIQSRFGFMVQSGDTARVEWGSESSASRRTLIATIEETSLGQYVVDSPYDFSLDNILTGKCGSNVMADWTVASTVAHEVIGHLYNYMANVQAIEQDEAIRIENQYHAASHEAQRCFWYK
jgi:RHS repeat-associated protein